MYTACFLSLCRVNDWEDLTGPKHIDFYKHAGNWGKRNVNWLKVKLRACDTIATAEKQKLTHLDSFKQVFSETLYYHALKFCWTVAVWDISQTQSTVQPSRLSSEPSYSISIHQRLNFDAAIKSRSRRRGRHRSSCNFLYSSDLGSRKDLVRSLAWFRAVF